MEEKCRRSSKRKKGGKQIMFLYMEEIVFDGEEFNTSWLCKAEKPDIF